MDYSDALEIYENLPARIREIKNYQVKRDLQRMYRTCENLKRDIARESVNSRHASTNHKLWDLHNKFSESVTNLDQYITLALLSM